MPVCCRAGMSRIPSALQMMGPGLMRLVPQPWIRNQRCIFKSGECWQDCPALEATHAFWLEPCGRCLAWWRISRPAATYHAAFFLIISTDLGKTDALAQDLLCNIAIIAVTVAGEQTLGRAVMCACQSHTIQVQRQYLNCRDSDSPRACKF